MHSTPILTRTVAGALVLTGALQATGCAQKPLRDARFAAKPNMTFEQSAVFTYNAPRLISQVAPAIAATGGGQNSGCTSCR